MNNLAAQLAELIDELHEVNQELAEAARPLHWFSDLDLDERREIADRMRTGLARWENVNHRIDEGCPSFAAALGGLATFLLAAWADDAMTHEDEPDD